MYTSTRQCHNLPTPIRWFANHNCISKRSKYFPHSFGSYNCPISCILKRDFRKISCLEPSYIFSQSWKEKNRFLFNNHSILNSTDKSNYNSITSNQRRNFATNLSSTSDYSNVAIIGGGISGLTTAYYLIRQFPTSKITLYESTNRLGGWLESESLDIGCGQVLFESGPRTLRFGTTSSLVTAELIQDLGLEEQIIISAKDSIAAMNKYLYYPDHLVRMPTPEENILWRINRILTEPAFKGIFTALLEFRRPPRSADLDDESVASFFTRRLGGDNLVNNIHSAILHGIYAGDINQLSIKSLFPTLWYMEKHFGSLLRGVFICAKDKLKLISPSESSIRKEIAPKIAAALHQKLDKAAVFSFKKGLGVLSNALEDALLKKPNFSLKTGDQIKSIQLADDGIEINSARNNSPAKFSHVVSTLLPNQVSSLTSKLPSLSLIPSVTVMVVNLYYSSMDILAAHGFGYLIPRNVPYEQNPECALGVVFDSDAVQGQDTVFGTKLTVMLGGHWWDSFESYPDAEEGTMMAKAVLKRHLGIVIEPDLVRVKLQRDCIPQYTVGHQSILAQAKEEMGAFMGRLSVTGCGYRGVGVNDCTAAARDLVSRMSSGIRSKMITGLEWIDEDLQQIKIRDSSIS